MPKKYNLLLLSLFSGCLLSAAWYWHLTIVIFFALVPLLSIEDRLTGGFEVKRPKLKLFGYAYLTFILWNVLVTWWVYNASESGLLAFTFNSLFMALVFVLYSGIKNKLKKSWGYWLLIPIWIAWEHWHTIWDISWTWLTIGNVFAFNHTWVQWYEFTGTSGGTFWVLAVNILIFRTIKYNSTLKMFSIPIAKIATAIIVPILISYLIYFVRKTSNDKRPSLNTVVAQPNLDPYNVKFYLDYQKQFLQMLKLIRGKVNSETNYLVLPETFITDDINEAEVNTCEPVQWFRDSLLKKFPKLTIIVGTSSYYIYNNEKDKTFSARIDKRLGKYFDYYNTALQIDSSGVAIYHKSKLVPGAEIMPFSFLLKPFEGLALNLGGTSGTRSTFKNTEQVAVAPVICYESVYADYVTGYIRNGANLIFIITNDGWWENTPGHVQHLNYARLRAIETRRQIARSANTGISCFINEFGDMSQETTYWEEAVIEAKLTPLSGLTFFARFGDLISYASLTLTILLIFWSLFLRFRK